MKCIDCDNLGWVSDEGEQVWGWCRYRRSCPDPDIDRDCPNFALKRPPMLQQLKAENENLRAEMKRMEACIYYKAGGFCRYGGDEPANVCVLGPCANEVAAHEFFAETVAEKGGRDHPAPPNEWVSVEERLPENNTQVLMWSARWKIAEAGSYYNKHFWVYSEIGDGYIADNITHWMQLPESPERRSENGTALQNDTLCV